MSKIRFEVPGEPQGKGRPRFANNGKYTTVRTPDKTIVYENLVVVEYKTKYRDFRFPDNIPLRMKIEAYYQIPKATSKKKCSEMMNAKILPTKKPDVDNILKVIADSLNNIAYRDDSQIAEVVCKKVYSISPKVIVEIEEIEV